MTSRTPDTVPLSALDLAMVVEGATSADALRDTTILARAAESFGYQRFWVAEHHNMPSVASTSPAVLMAHVAAHTERIKVGSGGVMLPNHAPFVIAEQFAMLEALHPGRVDLGIGRAPGTDQATAAALRRSPDDLGAEDFPRHLIDLMGMLGDRRSASGVWDRLRPTPVSTSSPSIVLLGSSGYSAQLAGLLGLPFAFAHHFDMGGVFQAVTLYREAFEPSPILDEPHLIVTANALAADTDEEAQFQAGPGRIMMLARQTGRFLPITSPDVAAQDPNLELARTLPSTRVVGDPSFVIEQLVDLVHRTGADELMLSTVAFDVAARSRSLELIAGAWPSRAAAGAPA